MDYNGLNPWFSQNITYKSAIIKVTDKERQGVVANILMLSILYSMFQLTVAAMCVTWGLTLGGRQGKAS